MDNRDAKLLALLSRAHECNAECITIEHKDREYFGDAEAGNMGIGIDRISAQDEISKLLMESIYSSNPGTLGVRLCILHVTI